MADRQELMELRRLEELEARVARPKTSAAPINPTEGMSGYDKFAAGVGSGAAKVGRGAANLAMTAKPTSSRFAGLDLQNPKVEPEDWYSDESIRAANERDKPLGETGAGMAGQIVGEAAATAPLGAIGKGFEVGRAALQPTRLLIRALTSKPAAAAVEGALAGAATADPDEQGVGSAKGAGIGAALSGTGGVLGRALKGLVKKSPEAELVEMIGAQHGEDIKLPLSQAAGDEGISGILKTIYGKILPLVPGASNPLKNQEEAARASFRNVALKEAAPDGTTLLPDAGKNVQMTMKTIDDAFNKAYKDTVKSYVFNAPPPGTIEQYVAQRIPNIDSTTLATVANSADSILGRYANGGTTLDGDNLIRAKTALADLGRDAKDGRTGEAYKAATQYIDGLVRSELSAGNKKSNLADLAKYEALQEPWEKFLRVRKAAARTGAQGGEFSPTDLKNSIKKMGSDTQLSQGSAPLQDLAEVGEKTVGQAARHPGFFEKALAWGSLGGLGAFASPLGAAALWGGGKIASSKKAQEALMGQTTTQREIIRLLREHPEMATMLSSGARGATVAESQRE